MQAQIDAMLANERMTDEAKNQLRLAVKGKNEALVQQLLKPRAASITGEVGHIQAFGELDN